MNSMNVRLFRLNVSHARRVALLALLAVLAPLALQAQSGSGDLTIQRIFKSAEFRSAALPSLTWASNGRSYVELRPNAQGGTDVVRVDTRTGAATVVATGQQLVGDDGQPISVEDIQMSDDGSRVVVYHNSVRVWRQNTRGVYHVFDVRTGRMIPASRTAGLQMFAKLSPDGTRIAFVRDNNLWVTNLESGVETQLTHDGSATIINGTTDWVYEEELGLSDAFRWSPDGKRIAFWRLDQSTVREYPLIDELHLYPEVHTLRYPVAGEANSRAALGVIDLTANDSVTWLDVGNGNDQYLARMEWVGNDSVIVQRLPRRQNSVDLLMVSATSGKPRTVFTDRDSAYVDVEGGELRFIRNDRQFLWLSDRTGWREIFLYGRDGRVIRQLTPDGVDVLSVVAVDEKNGWMYYTAAAPTPVQRNVYRVKLDGGTPERVTPEAGTHTLSVAPGATLAVDFYTNLNTPATATLYELPAMRKVRVITDNAGLRAKLASLRIRPAELFRVPMPDGTQLDAWRITPPDFDSTKHYPVLMYVYGGPAAPTVVDAYGGSRYLFHQMLAQKGYVVVSVDNRGAAFRGAAFRKVTEHHMGMQESQDQIDAAKWIGRQSWADASRIGIWGWSYGGYMTLMSITRGGPVFRTGLSVAPFDWRLYDTIYSERYMGLPSENAEGYRASSPMTYADNMTARLLIVHGTGDDNVHPQNTFQFANRLETIGKVFSMILYPNRTHGIFEGGVTPQVYDSFAHFILENL
jgi:dipeptidyl-peptidase 4